LNARNNALSEDVREENRTLVVLRESRGVDMVFDTQISYECGWAYMGRTFGWSLAAHLSICGGNPWQIDDIWFRAFLKE
jgi:hypothetical protein